MFAFGPHGTPLSPTACCIGSAVCALLACWLLMHALLPGWRGRLRWGRKGEGALVSFVGILAWSLNALLWSAFLLIAGLGYPAVPGGIWLIGAGFVAITAAGIRDGMGNARH
jgi:hypothetical protein